MTKLQMQVTNVRSFPLHHFYFTFSCPARLSGKIFLYCRSPYICGDVFGTAVW